MEISKSRARESTASNHKRTFLLNITNADARLCFHHNSTSGGLRAGIRITRGLLVRIVDFRLAWRITYSMVSSTRQPPLVLSA